MATTRVHNKSPQESRLLTFNPSIHFIMVIVRVACARLPIGSHRQGWLLAWLAARTAANVARARL